MDHILSGIKPTGQLTLGNYIGAINKFVKLQDKGESFLFIADLHALTLPIDPEVLKTKSRDFKTFGFIFEQMCIRDLKAYTADFDSRVSHYHDRYDLEVDWVLHLDDERYALIECKLGSKEIEDGAAHLNEIHHLIREHNLKEKQVPLREPDLKIIITGGPIAYKRPDGVYVIPLSALRP